MKSKESKSFYAFLMFILAVLMPYKHFSAIVLTSDLALKNQINQSIDVYHTPFDLTGQEAFEQIKANQLEETDLKTNPGMSFPNDHYWIILKVLNDSSINQNLVLEIDYPQLDLIEVFEINDNQTRNKYLTGDQFSFDQRPLINSAFAFPMKLKQSDSVTWLIHLEKFKSAMRFPMYLYTENQYSTSIFKSHLSHSIYFGLVIIIALASLVIGIILKHETFIIYSIYVLIFDFWLFTRLGYSYQFIIPNLPSVNQHLLPVAGQLAVMALILYVRSYFQTKNSLPHFHKVMTGVLVFFLLGYVVWFMFPNEFVEYATKLFIVRYVLFATTIVFTFVAAIKYYSVDKFRSRMFLLAYTFFLLAILSKIIGEYGIINEFRLTFDPIMIGFLIEVTVLTTAMGVILKRKISQNNELKKAHDSLVQTLDDYEKNNNQKSKGYVLLNSKATLKTVDIIYISADDHYLEYYLTSGKKEIDRNSLSNILDSLPSNFAQTHRSYIINLDHVKATYSTKIVMNSGVEIKLSRKYRKELGDKLIL